MFNFQLFGARASAEKFPGEDGGNKKRPKIALLSLFQGGGGNGKRLKNRKKDRK